MAECYTFDPVNAEILDETRYPRDGWERKVFDMYKLAVQSFWTAHEIQTGKDRTDFGMLDEGEQNLILKVLAFFLISDGIVMENLSVNFGDEVKHMAVRSFYGFQEAIESIHAETYARMLRGVVGSDPQRYNEAISMVKTSASIQTKTEWAKKYMDPSRPFLERVVAFGCFEGIMFSSSFAHFDSMRLKNLMPGLTQANELISRDEGMHADFAGLMYRSANEEHKLSADKVEEIARDAAEVEKAFVRECMRDSPHLPYTEQEMCDYVEYVTDYLLQRAFHQQPLFHTELPDAMNFVTLSSVPRTTSTFERDVTKYVFSSGYKSDDDAGSVSEESI